MHARTHMRTQCKKEVEEYLVQHGDLGVPVSVMDMAAVSALLASAEVCCPPLTVLLSTHILLARCYYCEPLFKILRVCESENMLVCLYIRATQQYQGTVKVQFLHFNRTQVWSNLIIL